MLRAREPGDRVLFVTGGAGFLGRSLRRHASAGGWIVVAPTSSELDVREAAAVIEAIGRAAPAAVAHLAYRRGAADVIVAGSRNVAHAASAAGARLVHLSTDMVFGGRTEPYTEDDEPDPVTDYGRQKLAAEQAVSEESPGAAMLRTSLLYGSDDPSPAQLDVAAAVSGARAMSFFTDEVRCPTWVDDVAAAVLALADLGDVGGPLHVAGPEAVSRAEFAALAAAQLGLDASKLRQSTIAESGIPRPAHVVLDTSRAIALGIRCRPVSQVLTASG